jgi:hypothetical protein
MYFPMRARFVFLGGVNPRLKSWAPIESFRCDGESESRKVWDAESFLFGRMGVVFVSLGHEEMDGTALRFGVLWRWSQGRSTVVRPTLGWRAKRLWRFFGGRGLGLDRVVLVGLFFVVRSGR